MCKILNTLRFKKNNTLVIDQVNQTNSNLQTTTHLQYSQKFLSIIEDKLNQQEKKCDMQNDFFLDLEVENNISESTDLNQPIDIKVRLITQYILETIDEEPENFSSHSHSQYNDLNQDILQSNIDLDRIIIKSEQPINTEIYN